MTINTVDIIADYLQLKEAATEFSKARVSKREILINTLFDDIYEQYIEILEEGTDCNLPAIAEEYIEGVKLKIDEGALVNELKIIQFMGDRNISDCKWSTLNKLYKYRANWDIRDSDKSWKQVAEFAQKTFELELIQKYNKAFTQFQAFDREKLDDLAILIKLAKSTKD